MHQSAVSQPTPQHVRSRVMNGYESRGDHWLWPKKKPVVSWNIPGGKMQRYVQRVMWEIVKGEMPPERIERTCLVKGCVNPDCWRDARQSDEAQASAERADAAAEIRQHSTGVWYARNELTAGTFYYLTTDREESIDLWHSVRLARLAGDADPIRPPKGTKHLGRALAMFLSAKRGKVSAEYIRQLECMGKRMQKYLGKDRPLADITDDALADCFARMRFTDMGRGAKERASKTITTEMKFWKEFFEYCQEQRWIERAPLMHYRTHLPTIVATSEAADKFYRQWEIHAMIQFAQDNPGHEAALAILLLGLNFGIADKEIGTLSINHLGTSEDDLEDPERLWLMRARIKTQNPRRGLLFDKTLAAVLEYVRNHRPATFTPNAELDIKWKGKTVETIKHDDLIFVTKTGRPIRSACGNNKWICNTFNALQEAAGIYRPGRSVEALRHTFKTEAMGSLLNDDKLGVAVHWVMGHSHATTQKDSQESKSSLAYIHSMDIGVLCEIGKRVADWVFPESGFVEKPNFKKKTLADLI